MSDCKCSNPPCPLHHSAPEAPTKSGDKYIDLHRTQLCTVHYVLDKPIQLQLPIHLLDSLKEDKSLLVLIEHVTDDGRVYRQAVEIKQTNTKH